jgi:hypothetical protein
VLGRKCREGSCSDGRIILKWIVKNISNVNIRQQIGLEETVIKEIEQNQLTWYGHVQRMAEGRLP